MKVVKYLFGCVLFLLIVVVGISLLLPSQVRVERSTEIAAPVQQVFDRVNDLKSWNDWSPWHKKDPDAVYEYSGPETGVGSKSSWISEMDDVGHGSQTITLSDAFSRIETELEFEGQGSANADWTFEETGASTKVT